MTCGRISMGINLFAGIMDGIPIVFPTGGFNGGRLKSRFVLEHSMVVFL